MCQVHWFTQEGNRGRPSLSHGQSSNLETSNFITLPSSKPFLDTVLDIPTAIRKSVIRR